MQRSTGIAIVAALLLGGIGIYTLTQSDNGALPPGIASGNGRIEAVQVDISSKIAGRVETITAVEGDLVEPGQVVATIDTRQIEAQLLRAQADVASAESLVAASQASIAQAQALLLLAEQELARSKQLLEKGHVSQEIYDVRLSDQQVAIANLNAARANLLSRERGVDAARATEDEIKTQIEDAQLTVPTTGRILYRLAEPGEVLGAGGKVLTMVDLTDVYLEFFLPAGQAHLVSIGAEARIQLDVIDVIVPAEISFVSPVSQFTPRQVETADERDKLMFRIRARVPDELVRENIDIVKTGVRGVAYVRLSGNGQPDWPAFLQNLPPDYVSAAQQ